MSIRLYFLKWLKFFRSNKRALQELLFILLSFLFLHLINSVIYVIKHLLIFCCWHFIFWGLFICSILLLDNYRFWSGLLRVVLLLSVAYNLDWLFKVLSINSSGYSVPASNATCFHFSLHSKHVVLEGNVEINCFMIPNIRRILHNIIDSRDINKSIIAFSCIPIYL